MSLIRVSRHRPLSPFDSPFRFFDSFDRFFQAAPEAPKGWTPPVDVAEDKNALVFSAELPGFGKEDIGISVEDSRLTISGERQMEGAF